jgi:hypothetical protein
MDAPEGLIVTITDIRRAGYCASGARRWFESRGFDFKTIMREGVSAEALLATHDAMAERSVAFAMERARG